MEVAEIDDVCSADIAWLVEVDESLPFETTDGFVEEVGMALLAEIAKP